MPLQILPLDLPGADMTALMKETVNDLLAELQEMASQIYSDGIFPGTSPLPAKQRLVNYLTATDPQDYSKIFDEDYLLRLSQGLETPPISPYWLNQLSVRSSYDRNRKDFVRLLTQADHPTVRQQRQQ